MAYFSEIAIQLLLRGQTFVISLLHCAVVAELVDAQR